jgi:hypothetical protein
MLQRLVNIIPLSLSGEAHQDSEPNLAVNPANTNQIVATALTPDLLQGPNAPIFVSTDGGQTWATRLVVPGNALLSGTHDISAGFPAQSGVLYVGILSPDVPIDQNRMQILRTADFLSTATMSVLEDRRGPDQPWVVADGSPAQPGQPVDRVYVGNNDLGALPTTAIVDFSLDAAQAAPPAGFAPHRIETDATADRDGPPIRIAIHPSGTIYAVHQRWTGIAGTGTAGTVITFEVVVTRDDNFAAGANPFSALTDPAGASVGRRLATGLTAVWDSIMGQERLGADSAIAVDPTNADVVWVAWGDQPQGIASPWTIHVRRSADRGQTWSADLRTVPKGKNPCLAISAAGQLGFLCQTLTGTGAAQRWETTFEVTADGWATQVVPTVLHSALAASPTPPDFQPYIGDYARLVAVGNVFYGIFSGSNHPDQANFPSGVTYQRKVNWITQQLLDLDGTTAVPDSIDPFFFAWT